MRFKLILFALLISFSSIKPQSNWTNVIETNINVSSANSVDIFTNRFGNHIIVQENSNLKYYKMSITGTAGSPTIVENVGVNSPSISGDENNIFIVYGLGNQIKVKRSTNGGNSWYPFYTRTFTSNPSSTECVVSNHFLHITYLDQGIVKYLFWDARSWYDPIEVSTAETGTNPRITAYNYGTIDKVYFMYRKSNSNECRWRAYNVASGSWETAYPYTGYNIAGLDIYSGFRVDGSNIVIYFTWHEQNPFQYYSASVVRDLSNNFICNGIADLSVTNWRMYSTPTADGKTHTAFYFVQYGDYSDWGIWRSYDGTCVPWDQVHEYYDYGDVFHINLSSAGNEVHCIWKDNFGANNGNNLRYKWDNQNPVAPLNLQMTSYNNHPKLVWQKNPELDINYYQIYRSKGGGSFVPCSTVSASLPPEWVDNDEIICNPPPGQSCTSTEVARYYIKAVDLTTRVSPSSNEVSAVILGPPPSKIAVNDSTQLIYNYELSPNFPNPFNPTTKINYQIKEKGFVTLKVFDILGNEVANLISETQDAGNHSIVFDASNLPSGIYINSLKVNEFVQNNKMIYLK